MATNESSYTRSEVERLTGIDRQLLDYWSKNGSLSSDSGGGGKGQHRRFNRHQVTLAAILFELHKLGLGGNAIKDLGVQFAKSLDWFTSNEIAGEWDIVAAGLIEYRLEVMNDGYAVVPSKLEKEIITDSATGLGKSKKLKWAELLSHYRSIFDEGDANIEELIKMCSEMDVSDYLNNRDLYFALSPDLESNFFVKKMHIFTGQFDGIKIASNEVPENVISSISIDVIRLKHALWSQ